MKAVLITSSILILAVAALRPLLRGRIDPRIQYALWLAVALRLLLPVNLFTSAYSALALLDRAERPAQVARAIGQASVPVPAMSYENAYILALEEYQQTQPLTTSFTDLDRVEARARELAGRSPTLGELAEQYARPVWLGGAALMAGWFVLVNARLGRRLRGAKRLDGVDCLLPVYVSDALPSPCLRGAARPKIYVTPAALESPGRLRHVLAHELAHRRHLDHWWALLRCALLCVYWFDPLVWWAAALSRQDCELACDAGAIRALGEGERIPYGRTLVGMIAAGRTSLLQTATTMTGGKRKVRERVRLIAHRPRTAIALALAAALILGLAAGCAFAGAPEESPAPEGAKTLDNLQERLLEVPEEWRDSVTARSENDALVIYYFTKPGQALNKDQYLLIVNRFSQERFNQLDGSYPSGGSRTVATGGGQYYVFYRNTSIEYDPEDEEAFNAAQRAVSDYAQKTLLDTEGVEPYSPSAQPPDALQERLLDVPEEWRDKVSASPALGGEAGCLASYALSDPKWADLRGGWLLNLYRMDEAGIRGKLDSGEWPAVDIFARSGDQYYALTWPSDGRYQDGSDLSGEFWDAVNAMKDHVKATVLAAGGAEPFDPYAAPPYFFSSVPTPPLPQEAVQAVVDRLLAAPRLELSLAPAGTSRVYAYSVDNHPQSGQPAAHYLANMVGDFTWEDAPYSTSEGAGALRLEASDGSASLFLSDGSYLVLDGDGNCWKATYRSDNYLFPGRGESVTPYDYLRRLVFDSAELYALRSTTVPDRGQSHEDVVREWTENWEGAMTKTAPGSPYACTYVRIENVKTDQPEFTDREALEEFIRNRNFALSADDFGKTWFGFSYDTVFVPVDQSEDGWLWAGNTRYYEGGDAPEGALIYSHVGYIWRTDEGWTCTGVGTGW